jgi:hypothetical protein
MDFDGVDACATIEPVYGVVGPDVESVVPVAAVDSIRPTAIRPTAVAEPVVSAVSEQKIRPPSAKQPIAPAIAMEDVISGGAYERVCAESP